MTLSINKKAIVLIFMAFIFSFAVRLIWVQQFSAAEQFKFNNEFMINTNDGYYFAEGARDILAGNLENTNDLSPKEDALSVLTAWLAKILPISFETLIFYMPAFFSSLIVIPIILIAREFEKLEVGFIAALLGSVAWSYYNRTMVGYYDTDFLNIIFPTILLWSLIWAIKEQDEKYFLIAALDSIAYRWWYPQSYALEFAFVALVGVYVVYQYFKKQSFQTNLILVAFMLFAMINVEGYVRFLIVLALFMAVKLKKELVLKYVYLLFGLSILVFIFTGGLDPIWGKLKGYVFKDAIEQSHDMFKLNFFSTMQTVRESGSIPLETFANRISGHSITFFASIVGYIWFAIRYPVMLMALPMVGLGFLAYGIPGLVPGGGLRFTVYAVPVMALGFGYLTVEVSKMVGDHLHEKTGALARYALPAIFTLLALYPNIQHIQEYKVPTVFTQQEVKLLEKLHTIADREDYAVTWWDYGYPIRYYSDMKTLIDGMKHSGAQNHNVSFMLSADPVAAAKLARLDVEYTEKRFVIDEANKDLDLNHTDYVEWATNNIEQMMLDYGFSDANTFLDALETDIKLPSKTRDIYFYLPNRMMSIFPTVTLFSNLDLMSGGQHARPLFYVTNRFKDLGASIALGNGIELIKQTGDLQIGNQKKSINSFITTIYDNQGKLHVEKQMRDYNSDIFVIYMRNYNQFLVLDRKMYDSLYIQLFVLENYDKNLFEPVMMDPMAKIYRLKI